MRTRIYNRMTAREVEEYLARGGDTIFIGVGVIEAHSNMPIDAEQVGPEGIALAMAEKADGLAMINVPYTFPGGTVVSNATVQVSIQESAEFLRILCRSLVAQGFRKIFFVTGHGPARMVCEPLCRDFFQEFKTHLVFINPFTLLGKLMKKNGQEPGPMGLMAYPETEDLTAGAYRIMELEQFLPVDPNAAPPIRFTDDMNPPMYRLQKALQSIGAQASMLYDDPEHHVPGRAFRSIEERDACCERGEKMIRDMADLVDWEEIKAALDGYDGYVHDLMEKYPRLKGQY